MKESFVIHTDSWEQIKTLSVDQLGRLFTALMKNQLGEDLPQMDDVTSMAFSFMAAQIDRDNEKYDKMVEKRKKAANARWHKDDMHMHNVQCLNDNDTDTVNDNDTDNETDNDNEAVGPDGLFPSVRDELDREFGRERVAELIDEVNLWAINNGKQVTDLAAMVRTFSKNQQRWGRKSGGRKTLDEIAAEVFADMEAKGEL